jgi:hypothetical protein
MSKSQQYRARHKARRKAKKLHIRHTDSYSTRSKFIKGPPKFNKRKMAWEIRINQERIARLENQEQVHAIMRDQEALERNRSEQQNRVARIQELRAKIASMSAMGRRQADALMAHIRETLENGGSLAPAS